MKKIHIYYRHNFFSHISITESSEPITHVETTYGGIGYISFIFKTPSYRYMVAVSDMKMKPLVYFFE